MPPQPSGAPQGLLGSQAGVQPWQARAETSQLSPLVTQSTQLVPPWPQTLGRFPVWQTPWPSQQPAHSLALHRPGGRHWASVAERTVHTSPNGPLQPAPGQRPPQPSDWQTD
jgi:hypothetical protein